MVKIAYFSMEIGLEVGMPTYSGGLGILAGDAIRTAADLKLPMGAVSLLYRKGYFRQKLDATGQQSEVPEIWKIENFVKELPARVMVHIEGRKVTVRAWEYSVKGISGCEVPVYFLDTDLAENSDWDRTLTHYLYGGDNRYRLCQEVVLGIGGVKMLRKLGHQEIERFHMNEGHSSFLTLELLREQLASKRSRIISESDLEAVRERCVFTTHTPVPAGHDNFPADLVEYVIGKSKIFKVKDILADDALNMTSLALHYSGYVNGVAKKHGEVTRKMFSNYTIDSITNGVHAGTWLSPSFQELLDRYIPGWRQDNSSVRYALNIPNLEMWVAHIDA